MQASLMWACLQLLQLSSELQHGLEHGCLASCLARLAGTDVVSLSLSFVADDSGAPAARLGSALHMQHISVVKLSLD